MTWDLSTSLPGVVYCIYYIDLSLYDPITYIADYKITNSKLSFLLR